MPMPFTVRTPEQTVVDAAVEEVIAPLLDGWIGVLPGHAPFQARVVPGDVVFQRDGQRQRVATIGGLLSVDDGAIRLLTGAAAVDTDLSTLEQQLGQESARARALETQVEEHFGRVYNALADTLDPRRRR